MMNNFALIILLLCFSAYNKVCGNSRDRYNFENSANSLNSKNEWSGYSYNIDEGHCGGRKLVDEDVKKNADPYTLKTTLYNWSGRGMYKVSCLRVLNRMPLDEHAAEARITQGGVGQGEVRIEMRSKDSQRTDFHVEIWGETSTSSGIALLTKGDSGTVFLNGKKYCECS